MEEKVDSKGKSKCLEGQEGRESSKGNSLSIRNSVGINSSFKEQVAFSYKNRPSNNIFELQFFEPLPSQTGISSKFSSCSSFDISPINSGRSTPLQFQLELDHVTRLVEAVEKSINSTKVEKIDCKSA